MRKAKIGHLGFLVQGLSYSVADKITDDGKIIRLDVILYGKRNVRKVMINHGLLNSLIKRFPRDINQSLQILADLAYPDCESRIGKVIIVDNSDIDTDDIAVFDDMIAGNS